MKINKGYIVIGLIIAFTLFFELAAHADVWDQTTTIPFSAPVQISPVNSARSRPGTRTASRRPRS